MPLKSRFHIIALSFTRFFRLALLCLMLPMAVQAQEADTVVVDTAAPIDEPILLEDVKTDEPVTESASFLTLSPADSLNIQRRYLPDSTVDRLKQEDDFWYANAEIKKKQKKNSGNTPYQSFTVQPWFKTLVWLIIIAVFAGIIIFYLAESNVRLFRRKKDVVIDNGEEEPEMPEDIFAIAYQKEIEKAERKGDYRMAVRLQFLRLLKELAEKNIIRYQQDKTNMDYLMQVHNTPHYADFFRITRHYEYSWYGQFSVSEAAYRQISNDIIQFESKH